MRIGFVVCALLVLCASASAQNAQKKIMTLDDVTDCTYFDQQIQKMNECVTKYEGYAGKQKVLLHEGHCAVPGCKKEEVGTEVDANQATPYADAARLCKDARQKYFVEKGKCEQRARQRGGGGPMGPGPDPYQGTPRLAQQLEALHDLTRALNEFGRNSTQQALTAIENAVHALERLGYHGAGVQIEGEDLLQSLGVAFLDQSEMSLIEGDWDAGAYWGTSWKQEFPDWSREKRPDTPTDYCNVWKPHNRQTCRNRCNYYFDNPCSLHGLGFRRHFHCSTDRTGCYNWCDKYTDHEYGHCIENDKVDRDSAGNLSLSTSGTNVGYYEFPLPGMQRDKCTCSR